MWRFILVAAGLLGMMQAQTTPQNLVEWDLICFCTTTRSTPHRVVRADNNGQILFAARNGITREQLKAAGTSFTESQIELLEDWRLLGHDGKTLTTAIPVLGPEETQQLRNALRPRARALGSQLAPEVKRLIAALDQQGYANNAFSAVFSYLLDGIVWDRFEERHALPTMEVTAEKPFWDGTFWAMYPIRKGPGTNSVSHERWTLLATWTESVLTATQPLLSDRVVAQLASSGVVTDEATRHDLAGLGVLSADGKPRVPVIHERESDPVYSIALPISRKIGDAMMDGEAGVDLKALTHSRDDGHALLIAYHEFMWELLSYFEDSGLIKEPAALSAGVKSDPTQIGSLVLLVEHPAQTQ